MELKDLLAYLGMDAEKTKTLEDFKLNDSGHWDDHLFDQFTSETDRGAIIVACSMFDIALETALRAYFVKTENSKDELFDDANSAISTFSAKINISYLPPRGCIICFLKDIFSLLK